MEHPVNPRIENEGLEYFNAPGLGPLLISILIVHFGFLFTILVTFSAIYMRFSQLRNVWKPNGPMFTSVFELTVIVTSLLVVLVLIDAWATRRRTSGSLWPRVVGYICCLVVIGGIGRNLYEMAEIPLNDEWYYANIKNEPYDVESIELGRILERDVLGCGVLVKECFLVELLSGTKVKVAVSPDIFGSVSSIVTIDRMYGRFSGRKFAQASYYVETEDAELFWRAEKR